MGWTSRPYAGVADLLAIEGAISASWLAARPHVNMTVGDLEWWIAQAQPGRDLDSFVRLWEEDGAVIAFGWFDPPNTLDWHVRAGCRTAGLVADVLDWLAERSASWRPPNPSATAAAPPTHLVTYAMDDDLELRRLLEGLGWHPFAQPFLSHWVMRLGAQVPAPVVAAGYRVRHVEGESEVPARVEAHRAAFAPSRLNEEKYRRLVAMPHYAWDRDLIVEAPDGSIAAFAMTWFDPVARVGEFEPVGTNPNHRRQGLALALLHAGLRGLRVLGAEDALVFSDVTNAASEALYEAAGFGRLTIHRRWTRAR